MEAEEPEEMLQLIQQQAFGQPVCCPCRREDTLGVVLL